MPGPSALNTSRSPTAALSQAVPSASGAPVAYFLALGSPSEVWQTDGTLAGTSLVAPLPSTNPFSSGAGAPIRPGLFALAVSHGLFVIDAVNSSSQTLQVGSSGLPMPGVSFAGRAVFPLSSVRGDAVLLTTDGSRVDVVRHPSSGPTAAPVILGEVDGSLWFALSDGTVLSLPPGSTLPSVVANVPPMPRPPVRIGARFYFQAGMPNAESLIELDATTGRSRTLHPGRIPAYGVHFASVLFQGGTPEEPGELWRHDPVADTTGLLEDVNPGIIDWDSSPAQFTRFGERVVFEAYAPRIGTEPWISDGTTNGTISLGDLTPGLDGRSYRFVPVGDQLWIHRSSPAGVAVFRSDGTAAGTTQITTLPAESIVAAIGLGERMLFTGDVQGVSGIHVLAANGTVTRLATAAGAVAMDLVARGSEAFALLAPATGTLEAWRSDGTAAGTRRLSGNVGTATGERPSMAIFDGRLWVASDIGVFVSDAAGTTLSPFDPLPGARLLVARSRLFAIATREIVSTTGVAAGVVRMTPALPARPETASTVGDRLLFLADIFGPWAYGTDGTLAGTEQLVGDYAIWMQAQAFHAIGPDRAILHAVGPHNLGIRLYVTDGTRTGTRLFDQPLAIGAPALRVPGAVAGGRLYLRYDDGVVGSEPWVVDLGVSAVAIHAVCAADPLRDIRFETSGPPVLGAATTWTGRAAGATSAALLVGLPATRPFPVPVGRGCAIEVDPTSLALVGGLAVDPNGRFSLGLTVPNDPGLLGVALTFQPMFQSGSGGVDIGPALRLQLGR